MSTEMIMVITGILVFAIFLLLLGFGAFIYSDIKDRVEQRSNRLKITIKYSEEYDTFLLMFDDEDEKQKLIRSGGDGYVVINARKK